MGQRPREISIQFQRGLRTRGSILSGDDALMTLDNVWLSPDDLGALQRVPGFARVNAKEVPDATFHRMARAVKSDGTAWNLVSYASSGSMLNLMADGPQNPTVRAELERIRKHSSSIVRMSPAGKKDRVWNHSSIPTSLTNPDFSSVVLNDAIFMVNGVDTPAKHDFEVLSQAGVTRPDITNATVSLNPGGENAVRGVVRYFIAQMTATTEGALSAEIGPIDAANHDRVDVNLTHADFGTNTYLIYRTQANEGTPYFLAETTGGTIYTDDIPDRSLGSSPYLNGDPPLADFLDMVVWNDRVWALTKEGILYWCDPENAESFATDPQNGNWVPVNEDDGDFGVALIREPSGLLAIKRDHIYRVFGAAPDGLEVRELTLATQEGGSLGAPSRMAITGIDQGIALYWRRAIYLMVGGQVREASTAIRDDLSGIRSQDEADGVYLGFYKKRRLLFASVPLSPGANPTHTYIYSIDRAEWIGRIAQGFRSFLSTEDENGNEEFWAASSDSGFIYKLDSGQNFAGMPIVAEAKLRPFFGSHPSRLKDFLYVDVHFIPQESGSLTLGMTIDGKLSSEITAEVAMAEPGHNSYRRRVWIGETGHELQLRITSSADQPQWMVPRLTLGWHEHESDSY